MPGQTRREDIWAPFVRDLAAGKTTGIINVVAWGCHSFEQETYADMPQYQPGQSPAQFWAAYREDRLQREQQVIEKLAPHLCGDGGKIWMITLVTKQDLWWHDRKAVQQHYTEGPYSRYIEAIRQKRGGQNFLHDYLSASLVPSNFITPKGEVLAETAAGYDEALRTANLLKLLETVKQFASRPR